MKKLMLALALTTVSLAGVAVDARSINAKQVDQRRRIDAGLRSGKLTHAEAARLKAEQNSIERLEDMYRGRNGGKLSDHAKAAIHARQDVAERHLQRLKDNGRRGPNKLKL